MELTSGMVGFLPQADGLLSASSGRSRDPDANVRFRPIADIHDPMENGHMEWVFIALGIAALVGANYAATRMLGSLVGKLVLFVTSLPAISAIAYTGFRFAYAVLDADEVNRRFRAGDLTYFGADIAFGGSLLLGGLWIFLAYAGHQWGREDYRPV